ncbi:MAG: hypothetical protein FWH18_03125 [Marinilabiliaceae bacterium]|nr:hypothetical protein [Marinilabiliaceae bacterium]
MKKRIFLMIFALTFTGVIYSQQKNWSIRANSGLSSGGSAEGHRWFEGYYFSYDVGVPLFKGFEIAPTFGYASMLPATHIYNEWTLPDKEETINGENSKKKSQYGENMGFISLLLHIKPFDYIKNEKFNRHQIILGGGISYVSYTMVRAEYRSKDTKVTDIMAYESKRSFQPYYGKVGYNFFLKNDTMIGMVGSWQGIKKKEAQFLLGFQFGIRF